MKKTIQERLIAALIARGYREIAARTAKYRVFEAKLQFTTGYYFVGRSGALRYSATPNVSQSVSLPSARQKLLEECP